MALQLNLKCVENLPGKADRLAKCSFRGSIYSSKLARSSKSVAYFGESFEWPVARAAEPEEVLYVEVFNYNKYLNNKLVGSCQVSLQQLIRDGEIELTGEPLADANNKILPVTISLEARYFSPDGAVGSWRGEDFGYSAMDRQTEKSGDDALDNISLGAYSINDNRSLGNSEREESIILEYGSDEGPGEDTPEQQLAANVFNRKKSPFSDQEMHRPRDFQVSISIIEATQLAGLDIDPVVKIEVGEVTKYSSIQQSTNNPFFNEFFVFDFYETPSLMFDRIITLTMYHATKLPGRTVLKAGNLLSGTVIGSFMLDVGTVYCAPDHQFYHKWAVLIDQKEITDGPKGFLKCDICCLGPGDATKKPKEEKDNDNIEGNLLLPAGVPMERQRCAYRFCIYRAEDIPKMDQGIMASMKKAITISKRALVDAYAQISFIGKIAKTSVIKSYSPEWKEQISFIDMFPPLCNRIRVQLRDYDALKDETIATHYLELPQIMDPGGDSAEGMLPLFGPSWIYFYGSSRDTSYGENFEELNEGIGEGCAYRGRLLLSLKTEFLDNDLGGGGPASVLKEKIRTSGRVEVAPKRQFTFFSTIYEANMIDKEYEGKKIYFEVSIGQAGNNLDSHASTANDDTEDESDVVDEKQALLKKMKANIEEILISNSETQAQVPLSNDKIYYYIPTYEKKPCLFLNAKFEDLRKRMYHVNLLEKITNKYDSALEDVREKIIRDLSNPHRLLRHCLDDLSRGCEVYMRASNNLNVGQGAAKTKLDRHRFQLCRGTIEKIKAAALRLRMDIDKSNVKDKFKVAREFLRKMKNIAKEPQHSMPDLVIWMVADKKRVAYHRIPSRSIISAVNQALQGKHCGKLQSIFLKKPGKKGSGASGWQVQAKLYMHMWLGMAEDIKLLQYLEGIPHGYEDTPEVLNAKVSPPRELIYPGQQVFQLRAYLFQGRNLIGSDSTGLSDPFCRVIISSHCAVTEVKDATLSPTWNQTLIINDILLYGDPARIAIDPPNVHIEVFDWDAVGAPEFLGRAVARPRVKLEAVAYAAPDFPAQLQWFDFYRGTRSAGECLASFELLQGSADLLPPNPGVLKKKLNEVLYTLPNEIRPQVSFYRIEIVFWGVRELKRLQMLTVDRPRIDIEIAGKVVSSGKIENLQKNSNFEEPIMYIDVELPDNMFFWPPMTIRCLDCRNFGREKLVGTHTISHIQNFVYIDPVKMAAEAAMKAEKLEKLRLEAADKENGKPAKGAKKQEKKLRKLGVKMDKSSNKGGPGSIKSWLSHDKDSKISKTSKSSDSERDSDSISLSLSLAPSTTESDTERDNLPPGPSDGIALNLENGSTMTEGLVSIDMDEPPQAEKSTAIGLGVEHSTALEEAVLVSIEEEGEEEDQAPATEDPPPPLQVVIDEPESDDPAGKKSKRRKDLIADLDWWSKYYVTKEDMLKEYDEMIGNKFKEDIEETEGMAEMQGFSAVDYSQMGKEKFESLKAKVKQNLSDKETKAEKKQRKKKEKKIMKEKKKKDKKSAKQRMQRLKGKFSSVLSKGDEFIPEDLEALAFNDEEDKSQIGRIKMYSTALEKAKDFGGFTDWIQTFDLYRGKKGEEEDEEDTTRVVGKFKGTFCVYKIDPNASNVKLKTVNAIPSPKPFEVHIRVYIIRAFDLHPVDMNGLADPYLIVRLGHKERNDKENKIENNLNPMFGRLFEFDVAFPMDSFLNIKVLDYDAFGTDDVIGETMIDLENRYHSKHRATCGLTNEYEIFGYNTWRNQQKPHIILQKLCKDKNMDPPDYRKGKVKVGGKWFTGADMVENEVGDMVACTDHLALEVLKSWHTIPGGCALVPEHIETRSLYSTERPGVEQGKLEMWVDMFPGGQAAPGLPVDITPRKPIDYELRVIVWNTDEVELEDVNPLTGEASSDIFVRGFLKGRGVDDQDTDVHYRSMTGEGNFNWRFLFPFAYLKAEEKIVIKTKTGPFSMGETEQKIPSKLTLQVWDADLVSADDFLGSVTLDLLKLPRPAKSQNNCSLKMLAKDGSVPYFNMFKQKKCKGWWPMEATDEKTGETRLVGKIEAELQLIIFEDSTKNPVGLAREDPEGLAEPNRPDSSFMWFMNPLKSLYFIIWKNYKWCILKLLIAALIVAFIALFIYAMPGAFVNKIVGSG